MSRMHTYDESDVHTAATAASEIPTALDKRRQYALRCLTADIWFRIVKAGATGGDMAVAGTDGSHYLPRDQEIKIAAIGERDRVSVIRAASTDATVILSGTPEVMGT